MNIGIVAYWFNRGQGTVARHLRTALDSLGHQTFVLARPAIEASFRPGYVQSDDVWDQAEVTFGSSYEIPRAEYVRWAQVHGIDVVFLDQNYQFNEICALREAGILTVGRFVWESFGREHVAGAKRALDVVYSLTAAEQERYRHLGIHSPRVHWGCHPELLDVPVARKESEVTRFFYPAGYLSRRKPTGAVVEAFRRIDAIGARLVIKAQRPLGKSDLIRPKRQRQLAKVGSDPLDENTAGQLQEADERISVVTEDLSTAEYFELFSGADVCLAPSRWEGLGLHLYESVAFGVPLIVNDIPPLNEIVRDGENGLLADSRRIGKARSGIPSWEPNVDSLSVAIESVLDRHRRAALESGVARTRDRLRWGRTVEELGQLLEDVTHRRIVQ
jgi:1,2-diacylglycerol 3-alpha-glucosyltransferase